MNCPFPDITNLRCWMCSHNPYPYELPILAVHASIPMDQFDRLRRPCWEDDLEFHDFQILVAMEAEIPKELTNELAEIGLRVEKIARNNVSGDILYAFIPAAAEESSSAAAMEEPKVEADHAASSHSENGSADSGLNDDLPDDTDDPEEDNPDDDWPDDEDFDEEYDDECMYPGQAYYDHYDFEDEDDEEAYAEDYDDPNDYLTHLNGTIKRSLLSRMDDVGNALDDLLQTIFDLYKVFPEKQEVLSEMEDLVCDMMDRFDEMTDLTETYNHEYEED